MTAFSRRLVAETRLDTADLIWPLFVIEGQNMAEPIDAMPGVFRYSIDQLLQQAAKAVELTIPAIAIFPSIDAALKDASGSLARDGDNLVCRAVSAVKAAFPDLGIICDVALDPFTSHGHDGLLDGDEILNDETIAVLCEQAVHQANAGCDIIAPSDMMDGRVGAIRDMLEASNFPNVMIMSYAAKYASAFYGPFRDAVGAGSKLGGDGKKTYQMDFHNRKEALIETEMDIEEGADIVMVKPGLAYLDIIRDLNNTIEVPIAAYQVSGEYAMLKAAAQKGWLDYDAVMYEQLISFKRAGASMIATYSAKDAVKVLG